MSMFAWWLCGFSASALILVNWSYEVDAVKGRIWKAPTLTQIVLGAAAGMFGPPFLFITVAGITFLFIFFGERAGQAVGPSALFGLLSWRSDNLRHRGSFTDSSR